MSEDKKEKALEKVNMILNNEQKDKLEETIDKVMKRRLKKYKKVRTLNNALMLVAGFVLGIAAGSFL